MECKVDEVDKSDESSELQWEVRSEVEVFRYWLLFYKVDAGGKTVC